VVTVKGDDDKTMRRLPQSILFVLKVMFIVGLFVYFVHYRMHLPSILIVHSYHTDYGWVEQINEGLRRILGKRADVNVYWQYMNTKNHPTFSYKQKAGLEVRQRISRLKPTVIITIDDDAQEFVGKFYINDPHIAIVFCGVNGNPQTYLYDKANNVTGILERLPLDAVKEVIPYLVAPTLEPSAIKVINLGDLSKTVKLDEHSILQYNWAPLNLIDSLLVGNFDEWKKAVLESNKRADCLYITNYHQLEDKPGSGRFVPPAEVIEWTENNATIPVLGGNGFIVEEGGSLALATSAYEQGEIAAKYALRIIAGESPSHLPIVSTKQFLVFMRERLAHKFNRLPAVYEAFARGIGKYFEKDS
jgi:ABC-type uncharacterized transport system substrate-binding protein